MSDSSSESQEPQGQTPAQELAAYLQAHKLKNQPQGIVAKLKRLWS